MSFPYVPGCHGMNIETKFNFDIILIKNHKTVFLKIHSNYYKSLYRYFFTSRQFILLVILSDNFSKIHFRIKGLKKGLKNPKMHFIWFISTDLIFLLEPLLNIDVALWRHQKGRHLLKSRYKWNHSWFIRSTCYSVSEIMK